MKFINLLPLFTLILFVLNACTSTSSSDAEVTRLTMERDSLRMVLSSYLSSGSDPSHEMDSKEDATNMIELFRGSKTLKIPRAVLFSTDALRMLTSDSNNKYVRFYFGINPEKAEMLTILGVGVDDVNKDRIAVSGKPGIIEFANPCPPCTPSAGAPHTPSENPVLCPDPDGESILEYHR